MNALDRTIRRATRRVVVDLAIRGAGFGLAAGAAVGLGLRYRF